MIMGTLLLSVFCVLVLNVQPAEIKKDTINKYVIDKHVIEHFDGTQLEGKTISKYIIAYKDSGNFVEKMHVIYTVNNFLSANELVELEEAVNGPIYDGLILVDGKEMNKKQLKEIKAKDIVSVNTYKPDSKVAKSHGEKGKNGVLVILTKQNKDSNGSIYLIDGKRVEKSEFEKLLPSKIASIEVNKEDRISVIDVVTKK